RAATKLEVTLEGKDAEAFALALDELAGSGLLVHGFSQRSVKAEYSPARLLQIGISVPPFEGAVRPWERGALPHIVATELGNAPFLDVGAAAPALEVAGRLTRT